MSSDHIGGRYGVFGKAMMLPNRGRLGLTRWASVRTRADGGSGFERHVPEATIRQHHGLPFPGQSTFGLLMKRLWHAREFSTVAILLTEVLFFTWYLWPEAGRDHTFFTKDNFLLIFKYSSIYGIAAIGAAIVIISGGIDLSPGAVIAMTTVVTGYLFVG